MKMFNISLCVSVLISMFFQTLTYKNLNKKDLKITFIKFIFLFLIFSLIILNNCFDTDVFKAPIGFWLIVLANRVIYKDPYNIVINTTVVSYAIAVFTEIVLSVVFVKLGKFDLVYLSQNGLLIFTFSFITNFISYYLCGHIKFIKLFTDKINKLSFKVIYKRILVIFYLLTLLIIDFKNVYTPTYMSYIISVLLVILIFIIFVSYLNDEFKIKNEIEKVNILLDNISNYEKIIDDNRINSHEMLNNLLLIKSFNNRNSKKFEKLLDDLIVAYDKNGKYIRNISVLPKGLKGIIYYKINDLDKKNYDVAVNISKQLSNKIENMDHDEFIILCKCFSILLDNAIDACSSLDEKKIIVDIYKEKESIIVSIENSCEEEVEIEYINRKDYSTKGRNRGLGLYIVKNLLNGSKTITLSQENVKGYFISKLIINKKDLI